MSDQAPGPRLATALRAVLLTRCAAKRTLPCSLVTSSAPTPPSPPTSSWRRRCDGYGTIQSCSSSEPRRWGTSRLSGGVVA